MLDHAIQEEREGEGSPTQSVRIQVMEVRDGVTRRISYGNLTHEEKENVLADLLVKSAISHALEKQQQVNKKLCCLYLLLIRVYGNMVFYDHGKLFFSGSTVNKVLYY